MTDYRAAHDPLCALLKKEPCHGIGGANFGHYLDRSECRNCGVKCDCTRLSEVRETFIAQVEDLWNEACAGNRNTDVCESCRAYADVISILRRKP